MGFVLVGPNKKNAIGTSETLAKFLYDRAIKNVVFIDKDARPQYVGLTKVWHARYPHEPKPAVYFVNPHGFKTSRPFSEIVRDFSTNHKYLAQKASERVMLFDTCIHTGRTMMPVAEFLRTVGFRQLYLGVALKSSRNVSVDLDMPEQYSMPGCSPFDYETMVRTSRKSVISERTNNYALREEGASLRREIAETFRDEGY